MPGLLKALLSINSLNAEYTLKWVWIFSEGGIKIFVHVQFHEIFYKISLNITNEPFINWIFWSKKVLWVTFALIIIKIIKLRHWVRRELIIMIYSHLLWIKKYSCLVFKWTIWYICFATIDYVFIYDIIPISWVEFLLLNERFINISWNCTSIKNARSKIISTHCARSWNTHLVRHHRSRR